MTAGSRACILNEDEHARGHADLSGDLIPQLLRGMTCENNRPHYVPKLRAYEAMDWANIQRSYRDNNGTEFGWDELRNLTSLLHRLFDIYGKVAYIDSGTPNGSKKRLDAFGYDIVNVPSFVQEPGENNGHVVKNAVDVEMALGIYDAVIETKNLDVVILLSGDGDYIPLVKRIKKKGIAIVVIAVRGHLSQRLANFATKVFYLEDMVNQKSHRPISSEKEGAKC
jgi:uncharacterized LabA/DUF88 family protein